MTNKAAKQIIGEMKVNKLYKRVINEIIEDSKNYSGDNLQERLMARLEDVLHGLSTGIVGSLIYYGDTTAFFKIYKKEIIELVKEYQETTGGHISDLQWFDTDDMFCDEQYNQNYLAWFAYESIAFDLMNALEE